jgi:hypothetical protein
MMRRIVYVLMGLVLIGSFAVGSARDAGAEYYGNPCRELVIGIDYNLRAGNYQYAEFLWELAEQNGCVETF